MAKLQSTIVFDLDDEPIAGIGVIQGLVTDSSPSIALNPPTQKQNNDKTDGGGPFKDVILLLKTFEKSATILAQALVRAERASFLPTSTTPISTPANTGSTRILRADDSLLIDEKMSDLEGRI